MRYQVPQFIEVEDKIFGPLTLKQFVYLAGGGGLCLIFFTLLPLYAAVVLMVPVAALSVGLAFYQVNGRPLIHAIEHAIGYFMGSKLYLWKQREAKQAPLNPAPGAPSPRGYQSAGQTGLVPKLSQSKLKDLAWSLNIKDRAVMGVSDAPRNDFAL